MIAGNVDDLGVGKRSLLHERAHELLVLQSGFDRVRGL